MKYTCKYCGKGADEIWVLNSGWGATITDEGTEFYHENCKDNTLGIHIEEVVDTQDLFGRSD